MSGSFVVAGEVEAAAALAAVGATYVPALDLEARAPTWGRVVRRFGVVWGLPERGPVRDIFLELSGHPVNTWYRDGRLLHLPGSRRLVQELAARLPAPVHLPWAFLPLNVDFAGVVEDWADGVRPSFSQFFSQNVDWEDGDPALRRVFSLPVRGSGEGTLHEPAAAEALEADVGIVLEVDATS
jgi:hypothetical protein